MNRRTILWVVLAVALVIAWPFIWYNGIYPLMNWRTPQEAREIFEREQAERRAATMRAATMAATMPATTPAATRQATLTTAPATTAPTTTRGLRVVGGAGSSAQLGSAAHNDPAYALGIKVQPRGAAVDAITLNRFFHTIHKDRVYAFQQLPPVATVADAPFAARAIDVDGTTLDLADVPWELVSEPSTQPATDQRSVTYRVVVKRGDQELLELRKTYALTPATPDGHPYEVFITYAIRNLDPRQKHTAQLVFNGPVTPNAEIQNDVPMAIAGFGSNRTVSVESLPVAKLVGDKETKEHPLQQDKKPLLWAGTSNAYFNAIVRPDPEKAPKDAAWPVVSAKAIALRGPDEKDPLQHHALVIFQTDKVELAAAAEGKPGGERLLPLEVFVGPKLRSILRSDYYATFPRSYDETLIIGGSCGFCTFTWLVNILVGLLNAFHLVLRDWGLAIIALVLLVRLLLHPITKKSQISMSKMGKMGPAMEKLKQKYADDPEALRRAQAEFIREQGVAPFLGCLPMFLQMPIWIALWSSLQSTFELRHEPFLWGFTWIKDLAQPDHLIQFAHPIVPGIFCLPAIDAINILPILMGVVFFVQSKLQKPPTMSKEQEQQQKMMMWMTFLIFPLLLYNGPSGLNLYILTSTAIGIWESKRVRKHLEEQEAAEKAGRVIIDAPATRAGKRLKDEKGKEQPKKRGIAGWLADLQAKAEEMRRDNDPKKRK